MNQEKMDDILVPLFGTLVGSFLNVVIYRLPRGESLVFPASHCPSCNHPIDFYDNIPILSWLFLRGKCRYCKERISFQYPVVEASSGLLWSGLLSTFGLTPTFFYWVFFVSVMMVIFWIDLHHQLILDETTFFGITLGILYHVVEAGEAVESIVGALVGYLLFLGIEKGSFLLFKKPGLGRGDAKLSALMGAWLGFPMLWVALFLSFLLGSMVGMGIFIKNNFKSRYFPFGPAMVTAGILVLFFGPTLLSAYLHFVMIL